MARPGGWASPVTRNRPYAGAENLGAVYSPVLSFPGLSMRSRPVGLGGGGVPPVGEG